MAESDASDTQTGFHGILAQQTPVVRPDRRLCRRVGARGVWILEVLRRGSPGRYRTAPDAVDRASRGHREGSRDGAAAAAVPRGSHGARTQAREPARRAAGAEG